MSFAERYGAKAGNLLLGGYQCRMAMGHAAAGGDQALQRHDDLFQRFMAGGAFSHAQS